MARANRSTSKDADTAAEPAVQEQSMSANDALLTVIDGFRKEFSLLRGAIAELTQAVLGNGKGVAPAIATMPAAAPLDPPDDEDKAAAPVSTRGKPTKKAAEADTEAETPPARTGGRKKPAAPAPVEIAVTGDAARLQLISQLGSPPSKKQAATEDALDQFDVAIPNTEYFLLGDIVVGEDSEGLLLQLKLYIGKEVVKKGNALLEIVADIGAYNDWAAPIEFEYDNVVYQAVAPLDE